MKRISKWILCVAAAGIFIGGAVFADRDEHRERSGHHSSDHERGEHEEHESDHRGRDPLRHEVNTTYKETCGACHLAYPSEFLPSSSWEKIVASPDNHFGESFGLDDATKATILSYLKANAADRSSSEHAAKIMKSLDGQAPLRMTEVPYLRRKHREVNPDTFKRKSIGSFSTCNACHKTADQGIYDDYNVVIPK